MKQLLAIVRENLRNGGSILELGCGDGALVSAIATQIPNVERIVAVDYYNEPKQLPANVEFLKQDIENLRVQGLFDLVILNQVLEHIQNPLGLLTRVKTTLNRHGRILIVVPNRYGFGNEARVYLPEHGKHYFLWDREGLEFSLNRVGFTCRFYNQYVAASHNLFLRYMPMLLRIQNPHLTCVAMVDDA